MLKRSDFLKKMVFSVGYGAVEHHFLWEESFSAVSKEHFSLIDEQVMKPRTESNLGTFLFFGNRTTSLLMGCCNSKVESTILAERPNPLKNGEKMEAFL